MLGRVWRLWGQRRSNYREQGGVSLKTQEQSSHTIQQPHSWAYAWEEGKLTGKDKCTPKFIVGLLTIAKMWKQTAYWQVNGWRCGVYLMECDSAIKEWDIAVCSNTDGPRDYHNKWSKSKTNIIWYHLHVESKKMILIYSVFVNEWTYLQNRKNFTDIEKQT